jgi:hypothetical protein
MEKLQASNCVGDMLWQPLSAEGPIRFNGFAQKPVTVVDLNDLPKRIADHRTKVVLVVGPCVAEPTDDGDRPNCQKVDVLEAILHHQNFDRDPRTARERRHITHLVVDRKTALGVLGRRRLQSASVHENAMDTRATGTTPGQR